MNRILIIIIMLLLYSCGTMKKVTNSESHSKVNIQTSYVDTSKRAASWEVILNSIMTVVDLSKIRITTFYQERDSSGKQSVKEIIVIDRNITTIDSKSEKQTKKEEQKKGVSLTSALSGENETKDSTSIERESTPIKFNFLVWIGVILVFFFIVKIFFKKSLKKLFRV